jgi:sigma-B regulation protein RsbU (phosphoserine phosphatase)
LKEQIDIRDLELNALLEITQAINNNLSEKDLYRIYKFTLLGDLKVDRLAMFVLNEQWECTVHFGQKDTDWDRVELPQKFRDLEEAEMVEEVDPFDEFDLVFPVKHKSKLLAVVFLGGVKGQELAVDTTFLRALTNILIVAIENKRLARKQIEQEVFRKEMEIAKKVQNFLFPTSLPKTARLKIDAVYLPHYEVGGDYYDYIPLSEDKFMICIADVSGKGVPAALLMSNFQASLRTLIRKTEDLDEIVNELNRSTFISSNGENFITVFIGIFDFTTRQFKYANCGHNPTFIFQQESIYQLQSGTTVLGMFDPLPFLDTETIVDLDQFLFFAYTDGLTETFNAADEQFGLERLVDLLSNYKQEELKILHQYIFKALDEFRDGEPFQDDITMISCQVNTL